MTKKQKKSLQQILIALALVILLKLLLRVLPALPTPVELLLYLIPYFVVGKDVLRKAIKGIKNRQPFDECFLMAVATVGAFAWATMWKAAPLSSFTRSASCSRAWRGQEPPEHFQPDGHPPGLRQRGGRGRQAGAGGPR